MSTPRFTDANYLARQYGDAGNLNARVELHARFSTNAYGWYRWLMDQYDLPAECHILELGCGPAGLWQRHAERVPAGWRLTLSDLSPGMVRQARLNLAESGLNRSLLTVDAQAIPFPDGWFDVVIANHMLYHVSDQRRALAEMQRVLAPGGRFFASTIGSKHLVELSTLVHHHDETQANWGAGTVVSFDLDHGAERLEPWFVDIEMRRYDDELRVTDAQLLADYVFSDIPWDAETRQAFVRLVQEELSRQGGCMRIQKDSGLFVARRAA